MSESSNAGTSQQVPTDRDIGAAVGRFLVKVGPQTATGCQEWTASLRGANNYGSFWLGGRNINAHRAAWLLFKGKVGDGLCVLHTCDNPSCVNTDHLYLGTQKDNSLDRKRRGRHPQHRQTHCKRGHPLSGDNLYGRSDGHRDCRACNKIHSRRAYLRRKGQA